MKITSLICLYYRILQWRVYYLVLKHLLTEFGGLTAHFKKSMFIITQHLLMCIVVRHHVLHAPLHGLHHKIYTFPKKATSICYFFRKCYTTDCWESTDFRLDLWFHSLVWTSRLEPYCRFWLRCGLDSQHIA